MKVSRVYRLLRLITLLQSGRNYTANALAEELGVSRRTVFRDLNMLEMARIPYYYDEESGGYRISRHFFLPPVNLTVGEALALLVLAGRMRTMRQLPLLSEASRAAMKLESALPSPIRDRVGSVTDRVHFAVGPVARHDGLDATFDDVARSVAERRVCRMVYVSFHDRRQLDLEVNPLRLIFVGRAWYLLAWSHEHGEVRTFKLGRIRKIEPTGRRFDPDPQLDVSDHFGDAWAMIPEGRTRDVHLHFEPKVAGNVAEVQWHRTQQVEWNDDGSIEFHARVDGLGEITWWILGYGDQAEVIAPPALRKRVLEAAERLVARYRGKEAVR